MGLSKLATAAASLAALTFVAAAPAEAGGYHRHHHHRGWNPGAAAAVGIIGGLAAGAAIASTRPAYGYGHGHGYGHPAPAYYAAPQHVYGECYVVRKKVWVPGWGWEVRRREVCD